MVEVYRIVQSRQEASCYVINMWMFKAMAISNMVTGVLLLVIGGTYMYRGSVECSASWIIFGIMYMVMDQYSMTGTNVHPKKKTLFTRCFDIDVNNMIRVRALFCAIGPILALTFLAYIWLRE